LIYRGFGLDHLVSSAPPLDIDAIFELCELVILSCWVMNWQVSVIIFSTVAQRSCAFSASECKQEIKCNFCSKWYVPSLQCTYCMECPHDDVKSKYSERMQNLIELDDFLLREIKVVLQ
jgi:hypothetical protein